MYLYKQNSHRMSMEQFKWSDVLNSK